MCICSLKIIVIIDLWTVRVVRLPHVQELLSDAKVLANTDLDRPSISVCWLAYLRCERFCL